MLVRYVSILLLAFAYCPLNAGIEVHFKKPINKYGYHEMRHINYIYMLNLDQRPEKFEKCRLALEPYGIAPYRFSAVNGWTLPLEVINSVGVRFNPLTM